MASPNQGLAPKVGRVERQQPALECLLKTTFTKRLSRSTTKLSGKPATVLLGRTVWELFPQAAGNVFYDELHRVAADRQAIRELKLAG
jgi:hypothetical protein